MVWETNLILFLTASLALIVAPGLDNLYIRPAESLKDVR